MTPAVEPCEVSVHFGRTVALHGLDLAVAPGETRALLGLIPVEVVDRSTVRVGGPAVRAPPLLLNGTRWIVLVAHLVILLPFTFSVVSTAQRRVDPVLASVASSLGASAMRVLWRVQVPVLLPAMSTSASWGRRCRWARSARRSCCTRPIGGRCR